MILDKDKSKLISRDILLSTYKELLDNSGLKKKLKKLEELIRELIIELYRKYVFSEELLHLFDKSQRIAKIMKVVDINFEVLGLCDSPHGYYPNKILTLDSETPIGYAVNIGRWVNVEDTFGIGGLPDCGDGTYKLMNVIDKFTPEEVDVLKNAYIDLFKTTYAIRNFKGGQDKYLPKGIKTYGQLHDYDIKIFEIAYNKFIQQRDELKAKNDEFRLDKNDIPGSLQRLKRILEL